MGPFPASTDDGLIFQEKRLGTFPQDVFSITYLNIQDIFAIIPLFLRQSDR